MAKTSRGDSGLAQHTRFVELSAARPRHVDNAHDVHATPGILSHLLGWGRSVERR